MELSFQVVEHTIFQKAITLITFNNYPLKKILKYLECMKMLTQFSRLKRVKNSLRQFYLFNLESDRQVQPSLQILQSWKKLYIFRLIYLKCLIKVFVIQNIFKLQKLVVYNHYPLFCFKKQISSTDYYPQFNLHSYPYNKQLKDSYLSRRSLMKCIQLF